MRRELRAAARGRKNTSQSRELSGSRPGPNERGDAGAGSRHSRLVDEIRPPLEDSDPDRARASCAAICRETLGDLAPALVLLPPDDRRRVQALTAHVRTMLDFAFQRGLEGERLAHLNRWEFEMDKALEGDPQGQPVSVAMALCEAESSWDREALDALASVARRLAIGLDANLTAIAPAIAASLIGPREADVLGSFIAELLSVLHARRRNESPRQPRSGTSRDAFTTELRRTAPISLERTWLRALAFLSYVADDWSSDPPRHDRPLGLSRRLGLLVRASVFGRAAR